MPIDIGIVAQWNNMAATITNPAGNGFTIALNAHSHVQRDLVALIQGYSASVVSTLSLTNDNQVAVSFSKEGVWYTDQAVH